MLSGLRVLDFTQFIAGPVATRLLGEMGAEIIKVELAPGGDNGRALPNFKDGRSAYFVQHNVGKKSLCVDLSKAEARELLLKLVEKVDVLVENFSPGVIGRLGFGWDVVSRLNPTLIMCSISAMGQKGPLARLKGFDFVAQAYSGISDVIGNPGEPPMAVGAAIGDTGTGMMALAAINAALYARAKPMGSGQFLDIAMIDFYTQCHEMNIQIASTSGGANVPTRGGSLHNTICPIGMFSCQDGYILVVCIGDHWRRLCKVLGRPELIDDPRYIDNAARMRHRDEVVAILEEWLMRHTVEQALDALEKEGLPCAPVLSVDQAMKHPHMLERLTVRNISDPVFGSFQVPGMPLRFSSFPLRDPGLAPFLGQHNGEVLQDYLGMDAAEVEKLTAHGALIEKRV
jgi:crotonobetainyl-CoA:carnitine CoA-transferase CaiB-like acyl-CoA transferase